jgi:hypothetical protein
MQDPKGTGKCDGLWACTRRFIIRQNNEDTEEPRHFLLRLKSLRDPPPSDATQVVEPPIRRGPEAKTYFARTLLRL